jgi:hypothetical protein
MRYFKVSLQFFAVFLNFYLFTCSTFSEEGTNSVLRNSGCKHWAWRVDIFAPRGPVFNPWAVHGGLLAEKRYTDEPSRAQKLCSEHSFRQRCLLSSEWHKWAHFRLQYQGSPPLLLQLPSPLKAPFLNLRRWGVTELPCLRNAMNSPANTTTDFTKHNK